MAPGTSRGGRRGLGLIRITEGHWYACLTARATQNVARPKVDSRLDFKGSSGIEGALGSGTRKRET